VALSNRDKTIGESFQAQTKYRRGALPPKTGKVVSPFKVYANPLEVASLPVPELAAGKGLWAALATTREGIPEGGRLRQSDVSQLLWATSGFTYGGQRTHATAVPIAGLETYLIVRQIEDVFPGVYHYNPREHALEHLLRTEPSLTWPTRFWETPISARARPSSPIRACRVASTTALKAERTATCTSRRVRRRSARCWQRSGWGWRRRCAPSFTTMSWRGFCRSMERAKCRSAC
jgi:hypothetical protein